MLRFQTLHSSCEREGVYSPLPAPVGSLETEKVANKSPPGESPVEERMDRAEQRLDQHGELLAELRASQLATNQNVDRLTSISERWRDR